VAHLSALLVGAAGGPLGASPDLELEVLAVFVPLPVVLAAKLLVTLGKGAGIRLFMPLPVFSSTTCQYMPSKRGMASLT
jgi:hypothetical protein